MANNNGQRVAAFSLALLFFLTTVGAAGYVIYELNSDDGGIIADDASLQEQLEEQPEEEVQDLGTIDNFDGPEEIDKLRVEDIKAGDGDVVKENDTVTIHYTGALASDGSVFDSSVSRGEPATFPLDNLIEGWQEGIPGMKVGGKRRLYIPSDKGYGETGSGANIPPNSDLIFDIELFATKASE